MDLFEEYRLADAAKALQSAGNASQSSIFQLKKFEWDRKAAKQTKDALGRTRLIQDVAISNNVIIIATTNCCILRWNAMDANREPERIEMPVVAAGTTKIAGAIDTGDSIEHVFIDPTANHVIIGMKSMDNYYLHSRSQKPKKLTRLQGILESVAFDRQNCTEAFTRSFLAGTSNGIIYEMSVESTGKEKLCQPVYQLDQPLPISCLYFDTLGAHALTPTGGGIGGGGGSGVMSNVAGSTFTAAASVLTSGVTNATNSAGAGTASTAAAEPRYFVLWATASPTRLYHLTGGPTLLALFSAYLQSGTTSCTELPTLSSDVGTGGAPAAAPFKRTQLVCYTRSSTAAAARSTSTAQHFALMTEMGIYHGTLMFSNNTAGGAE